MNTDFSVLVIFCVAFCSCQESTTEYFEGTAGFDKVQTDSGVTEELQHVTASTEELLNRETTTQIFEASTLQSTTERVWQSTMVTEKTFNEKVVPNIPSTAKFPEQPATQKSITIANPKEIEDGLNETTTVSSGNGHDYLTKAIDEEITNAILKAKLEPRNIPDKIISGSFSFFSYEAGLNNMKLYNLSSFARSGPAKVQRSKFESNIELELNLKSDSLILNGSAVLYFLGVGPKIEFEGKIDSVRLRVLFSYYKPENSTKDGIVRVKEFQLLNENIKPSLKITKPRSLTKFVTNIFFRRIVPYLGGILLPTIETVGRDIVHELTSNHGFVNSFMSERHTG